MNSKIQYIGISLSNKYYKTILEALKETKKLGGNILQIYLGNNVLTTLREKYRLDDENDEARIIKEYLKTHNMKIVIHAILTLNFCNDPNHPRNKWGIENLVYDMNLCQKIGGIGCVIHMGRNKTPKINITPDQCITNFVNSLIEVLNQTKKVAILLETPVQQNNIVGGTLEGFAKLFNSVPSKYQSRVKVCIDTCHIFSSGYDIKTKTGAEEYFVLFDKLIGLKNIYLIHLNDSKTPLNSHINRHAPIGQGFIFESQNGIESLSYLINLFYKNQIPAVLETDYENYKSELKYLKSLITKSPKKKESLKIPSIKIPFKNNKNQINHQNIKPLIINIFKEILQFHESLGSDEGNIHTKFRIDSYRKAIRSLEKFNRPIYSSNNVKNLEFIGKGFRNKINEIKETKTLKIYNNIKKNPNFAAKTNFLKIWGVGPKKAKEFIEKNIHSIKELQNAISKKNIKLTDQQLLGLKYYNDLNKKIPRKIITKITKYLQKINIRPKTKIHNAGSYRLGKEYSGDIDLIICYEKKNENPELEFYKILKDKNIIVETLSKGIQKNIYIVNFPNIDNIYHQMDVAFVPQEQLPWYLLYFGSSREFSKKIRSYASSLGYKLNEYGLFDKKTGVLINFLPKSEEEIFKYLKDDTTVWEKQPLEKLSRNSELSAFHHYGFWYAMDTMRDKNYLDNLWFSKKAPWKLWDEK